MRSLRVFVIVVSLWAVVASSYALAPVGAVVVLAPAMRAMLARATQAAVSSIGTTSVRAALPQVANVAGLAVGVTAARTATVASVLGAALTAGVIAGGMSDLMTRSGVSMTGAGLKMDPGQAPTLAPMDQWKLSYQPTWYPTAAASALATVAGQAQEYSHFCGNQTVTGPRNYRYVSVAVAQGHLRYESLNLSTCAVTTVDGPMMYFQQRVADVPTCPPGSQFSAWDAAVCTTNPATWPVVTVQAARDRMGLVINPGEVVEVSKDIGDAGVNIPDVEAPTTIEGPATVALPTTTTTTTAPDGTVTQKTVAPVANVTYAGDTITWNITTTTTTTVTAPGQSPVVTVTTEGQTAAPGTTPTPSEQEDRECGLPGTPKCAIDETGTPTESADMPDPEIVLAPLDDLPDVPSPAWSWTFALPSSCSVLTVGTFAGRSVSLDLCQYQPAVHSIMSMVWLMLSVFGCIALIARTLRGD